MIIKANNLIHAKLLKQLRWLDFQYLTIVLGIKDIVRHLRQEEHDQITKWRLLDVGAGDWTYQKYFPFLAPDHYKTFDPYHASADYTSLADLHGQKFNLLLCIEVLEHVPNPQKFLAELKELILPGGYLIISTPFAARLHYCPADYGRFSEVRLGQVAQDSGWEVKDFFYRGTTLQTLCNKLLYFFGQGLLRFNLFWPFYILIFILALPFMMAFILAAYLQLLLLKLSRGGKHQAGLPLNQADPLGMMAVLQPRPAPK